MVPFAWLAFLNEEVMWNLLCLGLREAAKNAECPRNRPVPSRKFLFNFYIQRPISFA